MFTSHDDISAERREYLRALKRTDIEINIWRVFLLVFFVVLWEIGARLNWFDAFIMSSPSRIIKTTLNLYHSKELFMHIGISCAETVIGFLLGTTLGTIIAILLWWSKFCSRVLEPYLVVLNSLPKTALGPIFIVWIGAGPASIIAITVAISLIVTILEVLTGFLSTEADKIMLLKTFGATRRQVFQKVVLPSNITTIVNSLKVNVGLSWVGVIVGEFLVSKAGLGYLIVYGSQVFKMDLVMAGVVILCICAAVMYQGIVLLEKNLKKNRGGIV